MRGIYAGVFLVALTTLMMELLAHQADLGDARSTWESNAESWIDA